MSSNWYLISTPDYFSGLEKDEFSLNATSAFQELLDNSPEAWDVLIDNVNTRVIIQSTIKDDVHIILTELGKIKRGSLVFFNNEYWLTITKPFNNKMNEQADIKHCYSSLRWLNSYGQIKETWFTLKSDPVTNFGISDGKIIELGNERRTIMIQYNDDTKLITKGNRFIFDDRAWKVTAKDGLDNGLITLTLEESELSYYDNKELRIADYYNYVPNFSISILNGNFISIRQDEQLQIQVEVKNRDIVIDNPLVTYSVSDESIAMIDENGLLSPISYGQVIVTATFENVSATVTVVIEDVVQDNKSVEILGASEIKFGQSLTYTCIFKNNGIPYDDEGIFSITADDGVYPTTLVSITSQVNNSCTIKAGSKAGYVRLHVANGDGSVSNSLRIQVKSLI